MIADVLLLVAGLVLLLAGADALIRGASQLARVLGASELVIGLTVVAFGTSAPELAVNGLAALAGDTGIAFGNIIGSNIANIGLIVGTAALIMPLTIHSVVISRELPMMLLATTAVLVLGIDAVSPATGGFGRQDGLALLLLFSVFLYYTASEVLANRAADPLSDQARATTGGWAPRSTTLALALVALGLGGLVLGGQLAVSRTIVVATALGVPSSLVGLTVVAVGTSLPELATSTLAAWRGQSDLAVGNVVGSNIFNVLFILGATASAAPVRVPVGGVIDLAAMMGFSLLLLIVCITHGATVRRWEGAVLLVLYIGYVAVRSL